MARVGGGVGTLKGHRRHQKNEGGGQQSGEVKSKGEGRVGGGVGATVGGQINKGGGVKKVGHCTDTGKDQGVK